MPADNPEFIFATAQEIADTVVAKEAQTTDQDARWPEVGIRTLQAAGLGGLVIPRAYGGLGQGLYALTRVCEILGQQCASTAIAFGMHCVGAAVIASKATDFHVEHFLKPISAGTHLTTLALSEPGTGAHFYLPQTKLTLENDHYRIHGKKVFVTNGGQADSYVVSVTDESIDTPIDQFSCIIVPNNTPGMAWGAPWSGLGLRGNSSIQLTLENITVSTDHLLGNAGDQLWYVFQIIAPYFLMAMAGAYLGLTQCALNIAKVHINQRQFKHDGTMLAQSPVLQHRMGQLWGQFESIKSLCYRASLLFDQQNAEALPAILSAKAEVAQCVIHVVNECMTLCGGMAYRDGGKLHQLLRDARAAHIMTPTTDLLRIWTGRAILGLPLLGD